MFKKLLFPADFSDISRKALDYVKRLRESGAEEAIVLHVMKETPNMVSADLVDSVLAEEEETEIIATSRLGRPEDVPEKTKEAMSEIENELRQIGFEIKTRIEFGNPLQEILRVEEEEEVSVIVLGSHGRSTVKEMLLGSVSEEVIRRCKKPVLVIKKQ